MTRPAEKPFIVQYGRGEVPASAIQDFIERWHVEFTEIDMPLSEFLGLTHGEYVRWFNTGVLPVVLK